MSTRLKSFFFYFYYHVLCLIQVIMSIRTKQAQSHSIGLILLVSLNGIGHSNEICKLLKKKYDSGEIMKAEKFFRVRYVTSFF